MTQAFLQLGGMDPAGIYFIRSNVRSSFLGEISRIYPRKPRIRGALFHLGGVTKFAIARNMAAELC